MVRDEFPTFGVQTTLLRHLEDAETFLDLRTLAALRVVVGPDALCGKMFSAVVALRETKMPRTLYAEVTRILGMIFESTDVQVSWRAADPDRQF